MQSNFSKPCIVLLTTAQLSRSANKRTKSWRFNISFQSANLPFLLKKLETSLCHRKLFLWTLIDDDVSSTTCLLFPGTLSIRIEVPLKSLTMTNVTISISREGDRTIIAFTRRTLTVCGIHVCKFYGNQNISLVNELMYLVF